MKSILLIGLGRFGKHIALHLNHLGHQVMAVDTSEERVEAVLPLVTNAQIGDSTNADFLESLGVRNYDVCIVVNGKLELLAEHENLMQEGLKNIDDMFRSLHRAIQLNKSLLLLSRIQNRQFEEVTEVNMNPHVRKILELLSDLYEEKELDYHLSDTEDCRIRMNESLAHTLLTNLIKNAIIP